MGKRKSKVNKQKQSKAANFGVNVVKKTKHGILNVQPKVTTTTTTTTTNKKWITAAKLSTKRTRRDDFNLEMKSLVERSAMAVKKQKTHTLELAPATLLVHPHEKSTARLVQETMESVQGGMVGIGQQQHLPPQLTTTTILNPLHDVSMDATQSRWIAPSEAAPITNPYAALEQQDSCDEEEEQQLPKPVVMMFQFAPPTFAFHSAALPGNDDHDEDDPDL